MLPDIDTLGTLGGALENYEPVIDPLTDLDAGADNTSRGNVAMMTHTAIRAIRSFIGGSPPTDPILAIVHDSVWGTGVKPTVAWSSTGVYNVFFPVTVQDELGNPHAVNLRAGMATASGAAPYLVQAARLASVNAWRVYVWEFVGGVPTLTDDPALITLAVW